ncbi:hypothetical protein ARMSODRAFT_1012396 [Armillaria solidipes]|uniref:Uncharacterized protein n=1 Tax=Armillaria solidipes TaxID=1076256 RepID=A0A2H3C2C2_9AGAR|nr:hypothetical protein ARMSODRAFT_1012396 [Armillaria solidipes]
MPAQILQFALRAILFVSLSSIFAPHIHVLASPYPMPLALMNYARPSPQSMAAFSKRNDTLLPYRDIARNSILDIGDNSSNLDLCDELLTRLTVGVLNFGELVNNESVEKDRPGDYQDNCVASLNSCKGILGELNLAIAAMRPDDKGLGNYDRNDRLETILKDVVNKTKDLLKVTAILVNNLPILGSTLGPIVYDLKCITEEILDAIEDITDGLLNFIKPLLVVLCKGGLGINVLGICI